MYATALLSTLLLATAALAAPFQEAQVQAGATTTSKDTTPTTATSARSSSNTGLATAAAELNALTSVLAPLKATATQKAGSADASATSASTSSTATGVASSGNSIHCTYDHEGLGAAERLQVGVTMTVADIGDGTQAGCEAVRSTFDGCMFNFDTVWRKPTTECTLTNTCNSNDNRVTWDCSLWSTHILKFSWDQDGSIGPQQGEQCLQSVFGVATTCAHHT